MILMTDGSCYLKQIHSFSKNRVYEYVMSRICGVFCCGKEDIEEENDPQCYSP